MSGKYSFHLQSEDPRRNLPRKIIIGRHETETEHQVLLKLFGYVLFYRDRLQIEQPLHDDNIPFRPDLAQLDYELRVTFWGECGECTVQKLDKLAVKVPEAEIWVLKRSPSDIEELMRGMSKGNLRKDRYNLATFDPEMFDEVAGLLRSRNELVWVHGGFEPPEMQFDFNGLWFDSEFSVSRF
jgi:uncharacterized protein YaeQ